MVFLGYQAHSWVVLAIRNGSNGEGGSKRPHGFGWSPKSGGTALCGVRSRLHARIRASG